jgi:hypothetical protein
VGNFSGTLLPFYTLLHSIMYSVPLLLFPDHDLPYTTPALLSFDLLCPSLFFYSTLTLIPPSSDPEPGTLIPPLSNVPYSPHDPALLLLNAVPTLLCSVVTLHYCTLSLIYSTQLPRQKIIVKVGVCTRRLPCGCSSMMAR